MSHDAYTEASPEGVAIIGLAGRLPGARDVDEFWRNQLNGVEAISHFAVDELEIQNRAELASDPRYVRARAVVEDADLFDAEFFGLYPREAELIDPQHRLFLECCWQAIEDAGYRPDTYPGEIGVYAGCSMGSYFLSRLCTKPGFIQKFVGGYQVSNYPEMMGNSLDFLSTRVSYKLNLRGPSFTVLSACSTSLLAVTQACQSLLTYQCDMALAGGVSVTFPQKRGYYHQDGGMVSPDGHCRAFDADAQGTVFGSGSGVVLLKRLEDALRDRDHIYAVVRGFAANNDGAGKVGYTAPSVDGQARVISMAQEMAGIDPETIGYIEAHGTGTPLGDPIELAGLAKAFRARTSKRQFCTIGTAKTNIGHLDIAAGVTGLINAINVVRHGVFPATLHFRKPNPNFGWEDSPFRVCTTPTEWKPDGAPRRAGISAFGVGGTNVHVVIEQAPETETTRSTRSHQLIVLSARSTDALERASQNLATYLKQHPDQDLADVAWTLQSGRRAFDCRRFVAATAATDAVAALSKSQGAQTRLRPMEAPTVSFLFPGQGSQHPNMAREIYLSEPVFRDAVDECAEILQPHLDADLRSLLYPAEGQSEEAKRRVTETVIAQPAIFVIEYALARLWMSWGVLPQSMAGHSIGEFVAACLAGVFSLEDALWLVATRGRMMQQIPAGGMLSVRMGETDLGARLPAPLSIAAVNSPSLCVVAGPFEDLERLEQALGRDGVVCRRLVTSHAFHSAMMDPLTEPFEEVFSRVKLNAPRIPYVSGVTGTWITAAETTNPKYWARHARAAVQFSAAIGRLRENPNAVLLEVGPGNVLATLARQHTGFAPGQVIVSSLSDGFSGQGDRLSITNALGALWLAGVQPDWSALYQNERPRRVSLPTYPFERKRYALDVPADPVAAPTHAVAPPGAQPSQTLMQETVPVSSPGSSPPATARAANASNRLDRVRALLVEIFEDLSGKDLSTLEGAPTFLELGFDSLFLTQVTQTLQEKVGIKIAFRQLLGDLQSLDALAQYVDNNLAPDALAAPAPSEVRGEPVVRAEASGAIAVAAAVRGAASDSPLERLMREQLEAMNQLFAKQLEAVHALSSPPAASAPPRVIASADRASAPTLPEASQAKSFGPYKPLQLGRSGSLAPEQRKHLDELISRVTKRTAQSKSYTQRHRKVLADPRVVSGFRAEWKEMIYPIVTRRSQGSRIWDIDGNEYIDLVNGFGPIMLGHRPEFVVAAIEQQLHDGFEIGPQSPIAGEVAELFCQMTGNERMAFCNTGSEAVLAALRVSRVVTGRSKVVTFSGDYHGMFDEVLVKGTKNRAGERSSVPIAPGIPRQSVSNMIVLDYGTQESLAWIRDNAQDLAAILVEPVQSRHPDFRPVEFLKDLRRITEQCGAALIFDEVVTGFRVHPGGCQALFGIRADLATYGKVVAGGMPIGVLAGRSRFMDALDGGAWQFGDDSCPEVGMTFFAGTFVRHPLVVAAMKAMLQHLSAHGPALQERLNARSAKLVDALNNIFDQHGVPTRIESFGSIFYLAFPTEERLASLFYFYLRDKGIHIREGFPCFLTTAHSDEDIARIIAAFEDAAREMRKAGFFSDASSSHATRAAARSNAESVKDTPAAVPLTEPQREIFLAAALSEEASCSFNESFRVDLRGRLRLEILQDSVNALLARHEALRARVDSDGMHLDFSPRLSLDVPLRDLSTFEAAARDAEIRRVLAIDARTPFDLNNGPLVRAQVLRLQQDYHVLVFTAHHIVCDGWSANILVNDLAAIYSASARGLSANLAEAARFSAYARGQLDPHAEEQAATEAFWLGQFKDLPPPLDLPVDRPRPTVRSFSGATLTARIGREAYLAVKQVGARNGCTLFGTLLAGFFTLLHRMSKQSDIVVGIPAAGQSRLDDGDRLVGHCVNFLPLRLRFGEQDSFVGVLRAAKDLLLNGYDHQAYTYGTLIRRLAIPMNPGRLPLMEVQFNLERFGSNANFHDLKSTVDPNPKGAVNFDLFFNIIESDDGLRIDCDYNATLFDEATIARWLRHYEVLLLDASVNPESTVDDLALMSSEEISALLARQNPGASTAAVSRTIHQLFEQQEARTPNSVAVQINDERLSYREVNTRANQLARFLQKSGVKPGDLVATSFERSADMIVAMLAVLKAGGAYVPIDSSYPRDRLQMLLDDANPSVVLIHDRVRASLPETKAKVISLDQKLIAAEPAANLDSTGSPAATAYVIYTSGSTGKPKGVLVTHHNVVRLLTSTDGWFDFGPDDVWTMFHSSSFDFSVWEIWGCLLSGGRLVVVPYWTTRSPQDFYNLLALERVTVLNQTPAAFYQLIEVEESGFIKPLALKHVIFGGEALSFAKLRPWFKRHGDESPRLANMYGITETTVHVTYRRITAMDAESETRSLIGVPIPDLRLYLLDSKLRPVPPGVVGEIYVGGAGVANGYLNRHELTAARFLPDPFERSSTAHMYRSGDLARFLDSGDLEYLGRGDAQVKIHGFRIELGEIESALAAFEGVRQCAVAAREDRPGERRLVAYVVPTDGHGEVAARLREYLPSKLPAHMIPQHVLQVDTIPLTANGKVDRDRLPAPDPVAAAPGRAHVAPRDSREEALAGILAQVLRLERVGVTDDLFQLGADSLHVFQITSRAAKAGLPVTPRLVLQERTIARIVAAMTANSNAADSSVIKRVSRDKYRISHGDRDGLTRKEK